MKTNRNNFNLSLIRKLQRIGFLFVLFAVLSSCATQRDISSSEINSTLELAARQYKHLAERRPQEQFPKTYYSKEDSLETSGPGWWVSGFYPGTLLYLYEELQDPALLDEAKNILRDLEGEQYNTTTHDLGFMMFCSFGNANRVEPKKEYDEILMNSAKSLAGRFDKDVGAIRSWDSEGDSFIVIIDNMMNLELLFWASKHSGDPVYKDIAVTHANTTIQNHFRPDHSSYHVVDYNENTGEIIEKRTAQGAADESAWARGQAWGLYGFTATYRDTGNQEYLDKAVEIADFMINHPNMPGDMIPFWDFNAPGIPNALRDSSAGAIMASALLELSEYVDGARSKQYFDVAERALQTLMSEQYLAKAGNNGGFILKHGVGHLPAKSEVDVPLTYGDYYFVEALKRYKNK